MDSFVLDFRTVDDFFAQFNNSYWIDEMWQVTGVDSETGAYTYAETGSNCYDIVLVESGGDNISDYLNSDGSLNTSAIQGTIISLSCALDWYNKGDDGATVELHSEVSKTFNDGEIYPIKAVFLRCSSNGYVMGYDINTTPVKVTNKIVFEKGLIFFTFVKGVLSSV